MLSDFYNMFIIATHNSLFQARDKGKNIVYSNNYSKWYLAWKSELWVAMMNML